MKKFLVKVSTFYLPIIILVVVYIATDVFKVIYHYDPYYDNPYSYYIGVNRSYGSTMTYINQNPKYHYNSFIFGNSRSLFYEIDTWKKYLPKGSRCMHFDESGGSISGVRDKIVFIDNNGEHIENALLVIDKDLLGRIDIEGGEYLFISPPILKNYTNLISFHLKHFMSFLNPIFLTALADYNMFGKYRPYMENYINSGQATYIPEYNEFQQTSKEKSIAEGVYYDEGLVNKFVDSQKPGTYSIEKIDEKELTCFKDVKEIFDRHKTSYKIVISPLYDQIKLNPKTYNILCSIFGKKNIYDFSGPNKWNKDYHNFYETSHYRPIVSAEIMDMIYRTKQNPD